MIVRKLGLQEYPVIYEAMSLFADKRQLGAEDELWVLQHFPVYTLGKAGKEEHLLRQNGIPRVQTDRGGQVTYHGPGQLIIYTLLAFPPGGISVHALVSRIEQAIIDTLTRFNIDSIADEKRPGVYIASSGEKIASLGLRIRNNSVYHGLSLNVNMDLAPFDDINPCGYKGLKMTQLKNYLPNCPSIDKVAIILVDELKKQLG